MSFIKYVCAFTAAFILSFILAAVAVFCFINPSCSFSRDKADKQPVEHSTEELYAQYMELSPAERTGKRQTLLAKAAHGGYLPAVRQIAAEAREGGTPKGTIGNEYDFWIRKAANMGDPEAQYEAFRECDMSDLEGLAYLSRAAEQNHGPALLALGLLYAEGSPRHYIARNERKAIECYRRAAEAKEPDARCLMYLLARLQILPEAEIAQITQRYQKDVKQAEHQISPSLDYPEDVTESSQAYDLLRTYLPANEKVKALPEPDFLLPEEDPFGENNS